ncbi:MAG: glycosyltransferase [Oscillospiraceae bacterium]|nr:glycosyltransferase [Oscillospiraceae bacterium]
MMLSVIIPVYNVKDWLGETVRSLLDQTFRDFELILVDDGSADGSGELCDAFRLADSRVTVIHQKNAGVSAARNAGLDVAQGEWIGWVDSDDLVEADMFERMLAVAEDAEIVQCQHDRSCALNGGERSDAVTVMDGAAFVRRMFTKRGGAYTNQTALWSKIYRRKLWEDIRFPVGQVYEDEMQTYKVCLKAKKILETEDILYHYVKRENSIITAESPKKMLDKQLALADRLEYLPKRLPDTEKDCAESFVGFSKHILCRLEGDALEQGIAVLLGQKDRYRAYLNRYDRLYLPMLRAKGLRGWVLKNDFAPIQNVLARIKR